MRTKIFSFVIAVIVALALVDTATMAQSATHQMTKPAPTAKTEIKAMEPVVEKRLKA